LLGVTRSARRRGFCRAGDAYSWRIPMDGIIYLVGLIVIVLAILSFFGLR
jgi:hypothetical protein